MIYVVAPGDTLSGIARLSGSSVAQLQQDNGILPDQPLVPGQALVVPDRDGTASEKPLLSVGGYAYPHIRPGVLQQALPFLTTLFMASARTVRWSSPPPAGSCSRRGRSAQVPSLS